MIEIQIETSTACSAKCHFCPHSTLKRPPAVMPMVLYKKLIDEVATIPLIRQIKLVGLNEPFLDPYFIERIRYAKEQCPVADIVCYTNGFHVTAEKFEQAKAAGLHAIIFSLNATNAEQHERAMGIKGWYEKTCENIKYAIENLGDVNVEVHAVINGDQFTLEDSLRFYQIWGHAALGGFGNCVREANWAGENRDVKPDVTDRSIGCWRAETNIYVMCDGTVTPCCFDPTGKMAFGNLNNQSLKEIYSLEKYVQFREDHFYDRADLYDICKGCNRI